MLSSEYLVLALSHDDVDICCLVCLFMCGVKCYFDMTKYFIWPITNDWLTTTTSTGRFVI